MTEAEGRLLWPWALRMRCLNNDEASLTWLVIRNALSGRQEIVFRATGHFARVRGFGGVYWSRLLSLPCRAAAVQAS